MIWCVHLFSQIIGLIEEMLLQVMQYLALFIIPLYTILLTTNILFPTENSPAGIEYRLGSAAGFYQLEAGQITGIFLANVLFLAIPSIIVALGLHWDPWRTEQVNVMLRKSHN